MQKRWKIAVVLGIRPDVVRACLILKLLRKDPKVDLTFIWSGQHYSDNLKDIFFRELGVPQPDIELGCSGETDAQISATLITRLYQTIEKIKPDVAVFLGDTNTVIGAIAALELLVPIAHIEGCMRCYNWKMPEERYRTLIDHISDLIYTYFDEYKQQGVREGLNPENIVVVGNPIVDVLNTYYYDKKSKYEKLANDKFFADRGLEKDKYYLMTCHRRETVNSKSAMKAIVYLVSQAPHKVYFPASYRTQKQLVAMKLSLPGNCIQVDPVGYQEMLALVVNSCGVLSDSGTVVEETSVLGVPTVQMRKSTERPQVYDAGGCVKFDPTEPNKYPAEKIFEKLKALRRKKWQHLLGDGKTSMRIVNDLLTRLQDGSVNGHRPDHYHVPVARAYREDQLP